MGSWKSVFSYSQFIQAPGKGRAIMEISGCADEAQIPDPLRVSRYRKAPDLGPHVLFFSVVAVPLMV